MALALAGSMAAAAAGARDVTRTVHFTATDAKGAPVTDLTAAEMTIRDGGRDRVVTAVAPATAILDLAIVVDDSGTGAFQQTLAQFVQALLKRARFAITALNPQPVALVDFTQDAPALSAALNRLGIRGKLQPDGRQFVEAIAEAASRLEQRKAERPVIVALTVNGEDVEADVADSVLRQLQRSGAMLNAVFVSRADTGQVLGDGPRQSGGRGEPISGTPALAPAMQKVLDHLSSQLVLTYALPDGTRPGDRILVSTKRRGITITAPTHVPNR
jgi:hypothetical protein